MTCLISCCNIDCEYNHRGHSCHADDVEIDFDGTCLTFEQKDIYKEVEGFNRESESNV